MKNPSPEFQVRDVKEWYVEFLATLLEEENNDHEELTAPLVVIASIKAADFQQRHIDKYSYEV